MDLAITFFALAGLLVGIMVLLFGRMWLKEYQQVGKRPLSKVETITGGEVEVEGVVEQYGELLEAPLSHLKCVWYSGVAMADEMRYDKAELNLPGTTTSFRQNYRLTPFYLRDNTGKILVDMTNAELMFQPTKDILESDDQRRLEYTLVPGDRLYIIGCVTQEKGNMIIKRKEGKLYRMYKNTREAVVGPLRRQAYLSIGGGLAICMGCAGLIVYSVLFLP